ncbi:MAG TPA: N-methyl-L-tryptophan oxidase [Candidatus Limnocylindrales bacterium]|jgi:sarcosine oxidase|nr:N-methyl-L-tryptophan oxidase [Candidatus Limnocylindrales bacterium]
MAKVADIAVVGLGAVGSATLYQAAKLGAKVIGIDRFQPPHDQGSSHGETRITRQAIGEGREFVPLVLRSNEIWEELEDATGRSLMTRCGGLVLAAPDVGGSHHGSSSFLLDTVNAAKEFGIPHQQLGGDDICRLYRQFRLADGEQGYFEPGAGFLRPEACVETQLEEAKKLGAKVFTSETVLKVRAAGDAVEVKTDKASYSAAKVIVTAGPWIAELLPPEYSSHFRVYRQTLCWFALRQNFERYSPERFPVFIWITGSRVQDMLYGFPAIDGPHGGLKVATERYENTVDPDAVSRDVSDESTAAMYSEYIAQRLPDVSPKCLRTATCLYTVTPDAKFVIDCADASQNILFASACSGHGFKHSPAVGEALAQRAVGLPSRINLSSFALERLRQQR